ncbi:MAG: hypothetical protein U1C72_00810, partial [Candidatus Pacearchaeota archaeon]|nr:hypothetical protein [Candidatus Pacearchaeota archaeon]
MNSSDTFIVRGAATFFSPVTISSATTLASLSVLGSTTLGDEAIDSITFNASTLSIPNDLNIDSATLFIDSANNRIGLGTTTPDQLLVLDDGSIAFSTGGGSSDVILSRGAVNRLDLAYGDSLRIIGGQLQLDLDDAGASQGIVFGLLADTSLYRSAANTLATSSKLLIGTSGLALDVQNTTDAASNQIAVFRGGVRAIPANNDTGYLSFTLDDGTGIQNELARLSFSILDVATSSKDGVLTLSSKVDNVLTDTLYVRGGNIGIGDAAPSTKLGLAGTGSANGITFGDDAASPVNLYRSAADTLKTDDNLIVGGDLTIVGLTTSQGSVTLGDSLTDTITFVGVVNSNIAPEVSSQYNLGSASKRWATVYADTVDAGSLSGTVTGGSTTSPIWNINSDNPSANAEISALSFETGTGAFNATLQWNASGDTGNKVAGFDNTILANHPLAIYSEISGGNQTFTSGTLFKYSQPVAHAITQSAAFTGISLDFSSNITVPDSASGNQTGLSISLKDGGVSATSTGISIGGTSDYALVTGATAGNVGIGTTTPSYKLDIATSTASDRGMNIANTAATGTNYGVYASVTGAATANYGGYFVSTGATTDYGLAVAAMTGATSTGLDIGALSGTTANKGVNVGAISGTGTGAVFTG